MKLLALTAVLFTGLLLLMATGDFPAWGDAVSPANSSSLSHHYIQNVRVETKVPNIVTAVLADYRGYDTMFETVVIFVAGIAILAILRNNGDRRGEATIPPMTTPGRPPEGDDLITVMTARLVTPVLQVFALYVVAHGHLSPGGGFQGGVMLGASFILIALTHGLPEALRRLPENRAILLAGVGIVIYAGTGLLCQFLGGNFLDYHMLTKILPRDAAMARSDAILIVEIGVAFTVSASMFLIYANLSSRGRLQGGL